MNDTYARTKIQSNNSKRKAPRTYNPNGFVLEQHVKKVDSVL